MLSLLSLFLLLLLMAVTVVAVVVVSSLLLLLLLLLLLAASVGAVDLSKVEDVIGAAFAAVVVVVAATAFFATLDFATAFVFAAVVGEDSAGDDDGAFDFGCVFDFSELVAVFEFCFVVNFEASLLLAFFLAAVTAFFTDSPALAGALPVAVGLAMGVAVVDLIDWTTFAAAAVADGCFDFDGFDDGEDKAFLGAVEEVFSVARVRRSKAERSERGAVGKVRAATAATAAAATAAAVAVADCCRRAKPTRPV